MMRTQLLLAVVAALFLTPPAAADDVPFVERPLTLAPGQLSADIGVGFAQLFFQAGDTFFGPEVRLFGNEGFFVDPISAGVAVGYTFGGIVDVKAEGIAADLWSPEHTLSVGIGVRF